METTEVDRVRDALKSYPKGITIAELAKQLGMNRISASKYLNMLLASGQAEMRIFGPSKVFYPCVRIPLSAILNFSTSHLLVMDANLTIIDANDSLLRFFGLGKEDLVGQRIDYSPIAGFIDPTLVSQLERALDSYDSTLETRITMQGKEYILKIKCIPTVFENGDHGVSLITEDITELTQYRQHLEELVDERAKELQKTNDYLKKEINSHKKSRIELKNSEKKYRELVENANSIIIKTDTEGKVAFFNEFAQQFYGYTESEVLGKNIYNTIIPATDASGNNLPEIREEMRLNPDKYGNYEGENLKKNGERVWISWAHRFIRDVKGEVTGILSIGNDITEQKRAEEALKESEERFRHAMEASSDGLWDWDITTDNGYFSPAYYRMLGYEPGEFPATGQTWTTLIHPDDRARTLSINQDCIENRCQSFENEYRLKTKDGSWKWILGRGRAVSRAAGGRALRMTGTHIDITERKVTEEALRENENLFREVFNNANDAIFLHEMTKEGPGRYLQVNDQATRWLGYTKEEFMEMSPRDIVPENLFKQIQPNNSKMLLDDEPITFESVHQRKDGSTYPAEVSAHKFQLKGKNVVLSIVRDITERKQAENALMTSQVLLTGAMDLAHLANWEYDYQTGMFTFDDRFYALYGTTAEREGGYQMPADVYFREFVHPDDRGRVTGEVERSRKISGPDYVSQLEHRIIRRDGEIRYITVRSEKITDNDGHVIKIHGVNQDITERKRAEEKLWHSEQKLSAIVDFLPDATFVIDTSGTVIAWNRAMEDLTGRKAGDIVGRGNFEHGVVLHGSREPMLIDFAVHPDQKIPEKYHFIKREKNKFVAWTYSTQLRSEGNDLWGFAVPLYDSNGKIIGAIEAIRDVTGVEKPRKMNIDT